MTAPTEVKTLNAQYPGLQLNGKCSLRKQQLKAFACAKQTTALGQNGTNNAIETWNNLPYDMRQNPSMIMVALRGSPNWNSRYNAGYAVSSIKQSVRRMLEADSVKLGGNDNMTLLTYLHKHAEYLYEYYRYDPVAWIECIKKPVLTYHVFSHDEKLEFKQGFDLTTKTKLFTDTEEWDVSQQIQRHFTEWQYLLQTIMRHVRYKHSIQVRTKNIIEQQSRCSTPRQKLNNIYEQIRATQPMRWSTSLGQFEQKIAERARPEGACLGLELEFIAHSKSDILNWCEDDFPQHHWMSFKTDGSINPVDPGESTARYQEWTYFLNGNNEEEWGNVTKTLKALTDSGACINRTCGNHVHLDMRGRTAQSAMRTATKMRDAISTWAHRLVHYKRAYNSYCSINGNHEDSRYAAVNTQCWNEHRTIEVRLGMATLNPIKLRYWVRFLQWMAQQNTRVATLDDFMQSNAPMDLKVYAFQRIMKFNNTYINAGKPALDGLNQYVAAFESMKYEFFSNNKNGGEEVL